ncbi:polysaccharide biosynthesis/export family protein [Burkholderia guangdongensis]|uniref:polysaccharide biosynthesis/export family protein n=1 Tax=Burkholderia guangdongensis TaxID=1792500 RepID=UPI0031B60560
MPALPAAAQTPDGQDVAEGAAEDAADGAAEDAGAPSPPVEEIDGALIRREQARGGARARDHSADLPSEPAGYAIGAGDVLQITVWDHPELVQALGFSGSALTRPADAPPGFVVDQDGTLQFPFAGRLRAEGLSPQQLQAALARRLAHVFRDPQVTVRVASFRAKRVHVEGEIREPGALPVNDVPMTVLDAIGRVGGFTASADLSRVVLARAGREWWLDLSPATRDGQAARVRLADGDRLRVMSRDDSGVFVMGEVNKPVIAVPNRDGRLTLSDAIAQAGSLHPGTADAAKIYVIRGDPAAGPRVYRLDATSPVAMILANQFTLAPRDVVYVDGGGLVRLHRVLSLLLPAINNGLTAWIVGE